MKLIQKHKGKEIKSVLYCYIFSSYYSHFIYYFIALFWFFKR